MKKQQNPKIFKRRRVCESDWEREGSEDGQMDGSNGIAGSDIGHVFVVDSEIKRVQIFDREGNFVGKWGADVLSCPTGIAVDADGSVSVSDIGSQQIFKFQ